MAHLYVCFRSLSSWERASLILGPLEHTTSCRCTSLSNGCHQLGVLLFVPPRTLRVVVKANSGLKKGTVFRQGVLTGPSLYLHYSSLSSAARLSLAQLSLDYPVCACLLMPLLQYL